MCSHSAFVFLHNLCGCTTMYACNRAVHMRARMLSATPKVEVDSACRCLVMTCTCAAAQHLGCGCLPKDCWQWAAPSGCPTGPWPVLAAALGPPGRTLRAPTPCAPLQHQTRRLQPLLHALHLLTRITHCILLCGDLRLQQVERWHWQRSGACVIRWHLSCWCIGPRAGACPLRCPLSPLHTQKGGRPAHDV